MAKSQRKSGGKAVFVSYNSADKKIADRIALACALERHNLWYAEWEVHPGDSLTMEINGALSRSGVLILVWSKNSAKSRWVLREWQSTISAMLRKNSRHRKIIPVVLDETPLPTIISDLKYLKYENSGKFFFELLSGVGGTTRVGHYVDTLRDAFIETFIDLGKLRPGALPLSDGPGRSRFWRWTKCICRGLDKRPHQYKAVPWEDRLGPKEKRSKFWKIHRQLLRCRCGAEAVYSQVMPTR